MKKLFLTLLLCLVPSFAHATTVFYVKGTPNISMHCDVPTGGGDCVQYYEPDWGYLLVTINGVVMSGTFDGNPQTTSSYVALNFFVPQISSTFGVPVTATPIDGTDIVRIEIAGDYTLSDFHVEQLNSNLGTWSYWQIYQ